MQTDATTCHNLQWVYLKYMLFGSSPQRLQCSDVDAFLLDRLNVSCNLRDFATRRRLRELGITEN